MSLSQVQNLTAFVQGASRGIGLELVRQLASRTDMVYASCRQPEKADALQSLAEEWPARITILPIDVTDENSIQAAAVKLQGQKLHLLINCAGILHQVSSQMKPEKKIEDLQLEHIEAAMRVNAIGPMLMVKHFFPLFRHKERSLIVNLSARVGSITDNQLGGWYSYRASKAAQNMLTKTLSWELKRRCENAIVVAFHPGTVDTELSQPFQAGVPADRLFSSSRAAKQLISLALTWNLNDNGKFYAWDGIEIPW
ncbi:MAG: SDR family oxidoreductase [Oligoflexus sp.]